MEALAGVYTHIPEAEAHESGRKLLHTCATAVPSSPPASTMLSSPSMAPMSTRSVRQTQMQSAASCSTAMAAYMWWSKVVFAHGRLKFFDEILKLLRCTEVGFNFLPTPEQLVSTLAHRVSGQSYNGVKARDCRVPRSACGQENSATDHAHALTLGVVKGLHEDSKHFCSCQLFMWCTAGG